MSWSSCVVGDCVNGEGAKSYASGGKYVGQFRNGKYNGQGTLIWPDGGKYVGQFWDGKYSGQGTLIWPDGRKHVGQFKNGKQNGEGTFTYPDGRRYVGQYRNGKISPGQGIEHLLDERQIVYTTYGIELRAADGQLISSNVQHNQLQRLRVESAEQKRRSEQLLARAKEKKERQLSYQRRLDKEKIAELGRRDKKQIAGIQRQLIDHTYLKGTADGIPGNKTSNAVKAFYRDAGVTRPALDDYTTIAEDLSWKLLIPRGNCSSDATRPSTFNICFTFGLEE
jgi:hypothetical protein